MQEINETNINEEVDWKSKYMYAAAEIENIKKRYAANRENTERLVLSRILETLVFPYLDDLVLIMSSMEESTSRDGIVNTYKKTLGELRKINCEQVQIDNFDPDLHEAVYTTEDREKPDNSITTVVSMGYTLNGKLVRPAKVAVNKLTKKQKV